MTEDAPMDLELALNVVVCRVIADSIAEAGRDWEDYPEIGEHDWTRIAARVDAELAAYFVGDDVYDAAYDFLKGRVENDA